MALVLIAAALAVLFLMITHHRATRLGLRTRSFQERGFALVSADLTERLGLAVELCAGPPAR
jgi:hypothetical protein